MIYRVLLVILRIALVVALVGAGWNVYRKLPAGTRADYRARIEARTTDLSIFLESPNDGSQAPLNITVELYPVDVAAIRREFMHERRAGIRFEEFLSERMGGRALVLVRLDANGQGTAMVSPGRWWLYATLNADEELEWRMALEVTGRKQSVELRSNNVYSRSKSF